MSYGRGGMRREDSNNRGDGDSLEELQYGGSISNPGISTVALVGLLFAAGATVAGLRVTPATGEVLVDAPIYALLIAAMLLVPAELASRRSGRTLSAAIDDDLVTLGGVFAPTSSATLAVMLAAASLQYGFWWPLAPAALLLAPWIWWLRSLPRTDD